RRTPRSSAARTAHVSRARRSSSTASSGSELRMDDRAHQPAHRARRRSATEPTLVRNQPALRSSDGTIWIVVAGGFALACAVPLVLILVDPGPSAVVAWTTAVLMVVLYAAL